MMNWKSTLPTLFQNYHRPLFSRPRNHSNQLYLKSLQNPPSTTIQISENPKCLYIFPATTPTPLILSIPSIMCGITAQWLTRSPKLWHGYLHSSPRDGTTTFGPAGSAGWETGSYKLRNIRTGLLVFVGVNAIVQRCFAMEVRELVRATLGKIKYTRRNKIVLTGCGVSSLVIDALCKQAVEENTAVA